MPQTLSSQKNPTPIKVSQNTFTSFSGPIARLRLRIWQIKALGYIFDFPSLSPIRATEPENEAETSARLKKITHFLNKKSKKSNSETGKS